MLTSEELIELNNIAKILGYEIEGNLREFDVHPRGFRIISEVRRLPQPTIENLIEKFKNLKNIIDAKAVGAESMVFLCPMCALALRKSAKAEGLEPYMLSNLVRLALGEKLTHGGAGKVFE